jgi:alpha/beta superfamily hydrolase
MNSATQRLTVAGPAGAIECALDMPAAELPQRGLAVLCHPHPQHGGSLDNKVVQTLARACVAQGWRVVRFNFRGVGASQGQWDEGQGEVDDAMAVLAAMRTLSKPAQAPSPEPLLLGGFSFGGYVAAAAARRLPQDQRAHRLVLVAPAVVNFDVGSVPDGTFVVHGERDDVVPLAAALDWARPQFQPVVVMPGVGHFFHGQLPILKNLLIGALR